MSKIGIGPVLLTNVRGPTSCAFGWTSRDKDVLYVSTSGGDFAYSGLPIEVSGKIVKVNIKSGEVH